MMQAFSNIAILTYMKLVMYVEGISTKGSTEEKGGTECDLEFRILHDFS